MKRKYLGDGVYAEFDGYHIWLITSDGIEDTNKIALEPQVLSALKRYVDRVANGDEDEG
jgi:hypothetical protein